MKILFILCCNIDWQPVISTIPCFLWGILGLILICVLVRHVVSPLIANCHEIRLKRELYVQETLWFEKRNKLEELKACTEEGLKNQVNELNTKVSELEGKLNTEKLNKELLEKQLKMYRDFFEQLKVEVKPKTNK